MFRGKPKIANGLLAGVIFLSFSACKEKEKVDGLRALPDLNEHARAYTTVESTKGPHGTGAAVQGDRRHSQRRQGHRGWQGRRLVVDRFQKRQRTGFIEMAAVQGGGSERRDATRVAAEGKYQTISDTQVRSGPGLHYPVVADLTKGTKITVVDNESGWLKVESKRGNKPGYVDASFARPTEEP
jgi:uncharacterized protein YgiM (DUF1202 family)